MSLPIGFIFSDYISLKYVKIYVKFYTAYNYSKKNSYTLILT